MAMGDNTHTSQINHKKKPCKLEILRQKLDKHKFLDVCKDCQCSNIKCNGALVANLDSFVRERKIDASVFARIRKGRYLFWRVIVNVLVRVV